MIRLREKRRWGADHIAHEVGLAASTVQRILTDGGLGPLDRGDRATNRGAIVRYQRDRPGELHRCRRQEDRGDPRRRWLAIHGRSNDPSKGHSGVGYRYIHSALDDRTRVVYYEIHHDEQADTAAQFWLRTNQWFNTAGITCERVLTDNRSCYRSRQWHTACDTTGTTVKKTRPRRPQTNGKIDASASCSKKWAYIRPWISDTQRSTYYRGFLHFYNHHRSHGALGWATPASTLRDNLPAMHS